MIKEILLLLGGAGLLALVAPPAFAQDQPVRIYIAPDDHTDYMWETTEARYRAAFVEMLDYYLDQIDLTSGNAPEWQAHWNCDGSYWVKAYADSRPEADLNRLIGRIRDGHISVPLNTLNECYGGQPAEAVLRGMFYAGSLERKYGLNLKLAVSQENQTLPLGLGALWAGAGARYSWKGVCDCATKISRLENRQREIYWWTGLDGSRILMKWNSLLLSDNRAIGGYAEARDPAAMIDVVTGSTLFRSRYPYSVIGIFGNGWDDLKTLTPEFVSSALGKTDASRKVIVSNEEDFFKDFETQYGASLPAQTCAFGNEWDLYSASLAEVSGRVRRAVEKLRAAEALATLVSFKNQAFMRGREADRDLAWLDLGLYWEHDWTADGPISRATRAAWQRRLAGEIEHYVETLQADAARALGRLIPNPTACQRFYVFNPLGWSRTDQADLPWTDTTPVKVFEVAGGLEVPSQIVTEDGQRRLRILAEAVPAVGYKVYEIRPGQPGAFGNAATVTQQTLENAFYRVTLDGRGAITSLIDKTRANREFVKVVGGRAMNDLGSSTNTTVTLESAGPVSVTLKATAANPVAHATRLTMTRGLRRLALRNDLEANFGSVQTWGFGLALASPDVWHEEVGAVIRARTTDQGGHYATRNARYDWLTLNHFADISGGGIGLTLANADCAFMKVGLSTPSTLDTATPLLRILAGGQVDGTALGIRNQDGDAHFLQRFALVTHDAFSAPEAMRFALEAQNPLVTGLVMGGSGYPASTFGLLTISNPDVLLWALKPAEDGVDKAGVAVRLWNMAPTTAGFNLGLGNEALIGATRASHLEVAQGKASLVNGRLNATLATRQLGTWLLRTRSLGTSRAPVAPYP